MPAVSQLTRSSDIKLNARVSLRRLVVAISFADDARTPFQCCLNGRLGRGGGGLALVPARLCRMDFQALTVCPSPKSIHYLSSGVIDSTGADATTGLLKPAWRDFGASLLR
jgi:hypothetical protein